jgi:hypothetical protein
MHGLIYKLVISIHLNNKNINHKLNILIIHQANIYSKNILKDELILWKL